MENTNFVKCMYAHDPEDEYCRDCDGITVEDEQGDCYPATACQGYQPEEPQSEEHIESTEPAQPVSQPVEQQEEKQLEHHNACEPHQPDDNAEEPAEIVSDAKVTTKGITTVIRAESGCSREINGTWFKFNFCEERVLPEGCDIDAEKRALWDSVNAEVDAQLECVAN